MPVSDAKVDAAAKVIESYRDGSKGQPWNAHDAAREALEEAEKAPEGKDLKSSKLP